MTAVAVNCLPTDPDCHVCRVKREVDDSYGCCARAAGLHGDGACHRRTVDAANVIVGRGQRERRRYVGAADIERRALEDRGSASPAHLVEEEWHMEQMLVRREWLGSVREFVECGQV